jgi:hypothetical protein
MILTFIKTKIGMSVVFALLLIVVAIGVKISTNTGNSSNLQQKVNLLAASSVKEGLKNQDSNLEAALKTIDGAPASAVTATVDASDPSNTAINNDTTATDRFARELFTQYAAAKKNGTTIDANTAQNIANSVLSNDYSGDKILISASDIKTTSDSSVSRAKAYGNALGLILSTPPVPGDQELVILERDREQGMNQEDAQKLSLILARYNAIIKALKGMTVPAAATPAHADLINGVGYIADGVDGILKLTIDPIGSLTKIKLYEEGINLMSASALKLKAYFASKNVGFSSGDMGYILTQ